MPDFDCYCAFCGVVLNDSPGIGSRDPEALNRRRESVREGLLFSDDGSPDYLEHFDEDHRYDPGLVSQESLEWLADISCIGFNEDGLEEDRSFFAKAEPYDDYGRLILLLGDDPNQPEETAQDCYYPVEDNSSPVFPFHNVCYEIFERAMFFTKGSSMVDGDLLYHVMAGLSDQYMAHLEVDYGPMYGMDRCWVSRPGEEFSVTNPNDVDDFYDCLREKLASGNFQLSPGAIHLGPTSPDSDPFYKLSNELIRKISNLVPYNTLLSLRSVSRPFYHDTRNNTFWKSRIASDMPWLWDLGAAVDTPTTQIDYMKLYAWLKSVTTPGFGVEPPFLAMANRRRIWQPCKEIARHCKEVRRPYYATEPEPKIVEQARRRMLLKVAPIQAPTEGGISPTIRPRTSSTIWLYSWQDLEKSRFGGSFVETFWNEDDLLTGIGVVFGGGRRILGTDTGEKEVARISGNDWISQMTLRIGDEKRSENTSVGIRSIGLHFRSGTSFFVGRPDLNQVTRLLCTSKDNCLVGVEGHVGSDGVISRLGILEAPIPEAKTCYDGDKLGPLAQRITWAPNMHQLWERGNLKISPIFPFGSLWILPWAKDKLKLKKLVRITAKTPGNAVDGTGKPILGLRAEFINVIECERERYVGHGKDWPEDEMAHLDLDGAGGEMIVEIGVPKLGTLKGLMLKTNRERLAIFEGDYLQGIAATFENDPSTGAQGPISSILLLHDRF
ncbi:hypothetical protein NCS56_00845600 [Fusarium sp. Ph1]|nr:hypothetical protein NCS56_00845600 [Fusarium sp. Ph1]